MTKSNTYPKYSTPYPNKYKVFLWCSLPFPLIVLCSELVSNAQDFGMGVLLFALYLLVANYIVLYWFLHDYFDDTIKYSSQINKSGMQFAFVKGYGFSLGVKYRWKEVTTIRLIRYRYFGIFNHIKIYMGLYGTTIPCIYYWFNYDKLISTIRYYKPDLEIIYR